MKYAFPRLILACLLTMLASFLFLSLETTANAQSTVFTYNGRLSDTVSPGPPSYDMQFSLYDNANVGQGAQIGNAITKTEVATQNGSFSVQLDFGAGAFDGASRFLEIAVRPHAADPNVPAYTTLSPRQPITERAVCDSQSRRDERFGHSQRQSDFGSNRQRKSSRKSR